jgi:diphosphomevalonate decarboxylase
MTNEPFVISYSSSTGSGKIGWRSPYSLELIKHFGEREHRLPANPSLSMTLSEAFADVSVEYGFIETLSLPGVHCSLQGINDPDTEKKICSFVENAVVDIPVLKNLRMNINARVTPLHSSQSISLSPLYSSLALCLCSIEENINGTVTGPMDFYRKSSYLARLGSGNACRSVYGGYVTWGKSDDFAEFSNFYAHPFPFEVHPVFQQMEYNLLIISSEARKITDVTGHKLMKGHPYSGGRSDQARSNLNKLIQVLQSGDTNAFVSIIENEASSLHAMIMSSPEDVILLKPETIAIIERVRLFRDKNQVPVCFTLNASPNVHLLYPGTCKDQVSAFVEKELLSFCENKKMLSDRIGKGPEKI